MTEKERNKRYERYLSEKRVDKKSREKPKREKNDKEKRGNNKKKKIDKKIMRMLKIFVKDCKKEESKKRDN